MKKREYKPIMNDNALIEQGAAKKKISPRRHKSKTRKRISTVFLCVFGVASVLLLLSLIRTGFFPVRIMIPVVAVILLLFVVLTAFVFKLHRKGIWWFFIVFIVFLTLLYSAGVFYAMSGYATLRKISNTKTEISQVGIYVKTESDYQYLNELKEKEFGILQVLDRENTNHALEQLKNELNSDVTITEFSKLTDLIDGLLGDEVDAIILNAAYLDTLKDVEGYEGTDTKLREVTQLQVVLERVVEEKSEPKKEEDRTLVIYVSGIDTRSGQLVKSNSDVNIIIVANMETHQMLLLSTPRDYYVPLSISDGIPDKLTHAGVYGVDVSMETLEMLYGIDIDYYVKVNFSGFERIIDSLGGITVDSEYAFSSSLSRSVVGTTYTYQKGLNELNGSQALFFARERYAFSSGDRQRGKNQMQVIKGIVAKVTTPEFLLNYTSFLNAIEGCCEMDIPTEVISGLVRDQLDSGEEWHIVSCSVDGTGATKVPYSLSTAAYVMVPDQSTVDVAKDQIEKVLNGEILD